MHQSNVSNIRRDVGPVGLLLSIAAEQTTFRPWAGLTVLSRVWAAAQTLARQDVLDVPVADVLQATNLLILEQLKIDPPANDAVGLTTFFDRLLTVARERSL